MTYTVPFLDLRAAYAELQTETDATLTRVAASGSYILGRELEAFESEFATYLGVKHCVGVGTGLDAIHLSLRAMNIGPGHEVIVPTHTYIATWLAVSLTGARVVPVEPCEATYNLDPELIQRAITRHTRAILPVHLYGQPADMDAITEAATERGLWILEDAAQAHGALYKGRCAGSLGHAAAWSFYPTKNLGAVGDGGAVTTNDDHLAERLRLLRNYGSRTKYIHELQAGNSRLDEIQAAVLRLKLRHLNDWNSRRSRIAETYHQALKDTNLALPCVPAWADPVWHLYVIATDNRDTIQHQLAQSGIQALIHYPIPPHLQQAYSHARYSPGAFPIAEALANRLLSLPMGPHLDHQQQAHVIRVLHKLCSR